MNLQGLKVVSFESRHSETIGGLIRLQGGAPMLAPSMKEVPLEDNPAVFGFGEKLLAGRIDVLIFLTGVGAKALLTVLETRHPREEILEAFRKTTIVPRGPKPVRILNEWKVPFAATVPEPNTWRELIDTLDREKIALKGRRVAVQEYGAPNAELTAALATRGALVLSVPVYRWALPDDLGPLHRAIEAIAAGEADVAIFTTAVQVDHLLQVAETDGLRSKVLKALEKMAVASVGPDCSEALRRHGIAVDIEPESPKMGPLVLAAAEKAPDILSAKRNPVSCAAEVQSGVLQAMAEEELRQSIFLKACRREKTSRTPVWLMRQAGRYMKDYRDIREKTTFLELCRNKELVTEVTVHAQEKIGADAAIIFSDILLVFEPMGLGLSYQKGDGPLIANPVRNAQDVEALQEEGAEKALSYVYDSIRMTRRALKSDIPLIGFCGAPFTLASYMIEGGSSKDFSRTRQFMVSDEGAWKLLLKKITRVCRDHLNAQIASGVQAVQVFDSWAGVLGPDEYRRYAMPYSSELMQGVRRGVPIIHFGTKTGGFLDLIRAAGGHVIGADHLSPLDEAWKKIGEDRAIQGNLDPKVLCGPLPEIRREVERILREAAGRPGHIFNLGHGVLPETPEENVIALVEMVRELSAR